MKIFRFVASSSVDENILRRAKKKMVLDHLVIQNMDTTGKSVINGGKSQRDGSVPFNKAEVNMILKFGAEDLFKTDESEEQDKEVDLDAILESAETREEEEVPQSAANKELLSAFKCTNIAIDENEDDEKATEEEQVPKDWSNIIPSAMIEQHKPKTEIEEIYSDPEDLIKEIIKRKKREATMKRKAEVQSLREAKMAAKREGKSHHCPYCSKAYGKQPYLNEHIRKLHPNEEVPNNNKKYQCTHCQKKYTTGKALAKHCKEKHNVAVEELNEDLKMNIMSHEIPEMEEASVQEDNAFNVQALDKTHVTEMAGHSGGEESLLSKLKPVRVNVKKMRISAEEMESLPVKILFISKKINANVITKNCKCPYCSKAYSRRDALNGHIRKVHPSEEVPIYELGRSSKAKKGNAVAAQVKTVASISNCNKKNENDSGSQTVVEKDIDIE